MKIPLVWAGSTELCTWGTAALSQPCSGQAPAVGLQAGARGIVTASPPPSMSKTPQHSDLNTLLLPVI